MGISTETGPLGKTSENMVSSMKFSVFRNLKFKFQNRRMKDKKIKQRGSDLTPGAPLIGQQTLMRDDDD